MTSQDDHDLDEGSPLPNQSVDDSGIEPKAAEPGGDADIEELQADIERTRAQLGQTVEALSHKVDVRAQARERFADAKAQANSQITHARFWAADKADRGRQAATDADGKPLAAVRIGAPVALGVVVIVVGLLVWKRNR